MANLKSLIFWKETLRPFYICLGLILISLVSGWGKDFNIGISSFGRLFFAFIGISCVITSGFLMASYFVVSNTDSPSVKKIKLLTTQISPKDQFFVMFLFTILFFFTNVLAFIPCDGTWFFSIWGAIGLAYLFSVIQGFRYLFLIQSF